MLSVEKLGSKSRKIYFFHELFNDAVFGDVMSLTQVTKVVMKNWNMKSMFNQLPIYRMNSLLMSYSRNAGRGVVGCGVLGCDTCVVVIDATCLLRDVARLNGVTTQKTTLHVFTTSKISSTREDIVIRN